MRWFLVTLLVACLYLGQIIAAPAEVVPQYANGVALLNARDDASATSTGADQTSSQFSTIATATTDAPTTTTSASSTTHSASQTTKTNQTAANTSIPSLGSSGSSSNSTSSSSKMVYQGGLPIRPEITPAVGVAGIILMAAGAALTFIGIRKPRYHIFLSTGLLAALGVTVLIEYVMSPPASNAVQGGYLVAIFVSGAVFGGLALVFKEITEGLCCLLGGFCIGMWLLTIKAGGLVTADGAKIGFILAFAGGFFCLAFSRYTRAYGSMICTSFGGATTLVLGIDCFSRAGLKEFWLYVWALNVDMFPLNTNTYPITRNIRVESAIIIIVTAFGVIFQLRLWKVIKERREKEEGIRQEAQRQKDEAEAEVGRQLEENNRKERAEWEQMYGNGSDAKEPSMSETAVADDSRRGSSSYGSSVHEKGASLEMKEMTSPDRSARLSDSGNNLEVVEEVVAENAEHLQDDQALQEHENIPHREGHANPQALEAPVAVPRHPKSGANVPADNGSEHGAVLGSEVASLRSKRFSGRSFKNRLSWRSGHHGANQSMQSQSEEALIVATDATSSVAGIADDLQSISSERFSLATEVPENTEDVSKEICEHKVFSEEHEADNINKNNFLENNSEIKVISHEVTEVTTNPQSEHGTVKDDGVKQEDPKSTAVVETELVDKKDKKSDKHEVEQAKTTEPEGKADPVSTDAPQEQQKQEQDGSSVKRDELKTEDVIPESKFTVTHGIEQNAEQAPARTVNEEPTSDHAPFSQNKKPAERPKLNVSTVQSIPEQTSRVVNSFRTGEWAKHLADAEHPEIEPIPDEIGLEDDTAPEEFAAPVDMNGLLQTPLNAQPPPVVSSPIPTSPDQSYPRTRGPSASPELNYSKLRGSMQNLNTAISPPISRNISSGSLSPPDHNDMAALRNSMSTPYLSPVTASKSQEAVDSPRWSGPPPLLAVRENMMRNRLSSTSLRYDPRTASRSQSRQSLADPTGVVSPTLTIPEEHDEITEAVHNEDDVPLSKRKAMLQRQTMRSPSGNSVQSLERTKSPTYVPTSSPGPADSGRSAAAMAAWRQSVRDDISKSRDSLVYSPQPNARQEKSRTTWGSVQQMRDASNTQIGNAIADEMQRGNMTDLHRKAMQKMQASANRQL
ncbi:hypothetical protein N7478_005587 [Penicillium angulare]|uniref:uncharacterized protein n=1 Tax=Penicillium angulare TaxID=116970 RepID=UPI002541DE10|nr:uncharacterized protein N7478_005587 [Penicillium angulare]KAJ5280215.1 hypothetical protein N7478_005587 [Penicillium angulare]